MKPPTIATRIDTWPIVVSTLHGTEHSMEMLDETMSVWFSCVTRGPHALIVDMSQGHAGGSAKQRMRIGEGVSAWMKVPANTQALRNIVSLILVFENVVIRGFVTAVSWLVPSTTPYTVAQDLDQAVTQASAALAKQGIALAPELVARARGLPPRASVRRPSY